jgi:hypothetical protein
MKKMIFAAAVLSMSAAFAQSDNAADNKQYVDKSMAELAGYIDAKCGDFKVNLRFDDAGFDYTKNPTLGTPTAFDRASAGVYAVAAVCEMGDAPSARIKSKFNAIVVKQGAGNVAKLSGKTLEITYSARSTEPFGKLREQYVAQLNKL